MGVASIEIDTTVFVGLRLEFILYFVYRRLIEPDRVESGGGAGYDRYSG